MKTEPARETFLAEGRMLITIDSFLIPLINWFYLRGRCHQCDETISVHYVIMDWAIFLIFIWCLLILLFILSLTSKRLQVQTLCWSLFSYFP
ncbi:MAG TPA: hypothetical protein ENI91_02065 [Sphingomonadales bacterium]|nr:hypothetical protein [Sphingomonadales bacterium]